jgi:hypothetical protein
MATRKWGSETLVNSGLTGNQAFTLISTAFTFTPGELRFTPGATTVLFMDVNGDAVTDMQIALVGNFALVNIDFFL